MNVIAEGCFSKVTKILVGALQFFLSNNVDPEEAKASNDEDKEVLLFISFDNLILY